MCIWYLEDDTHLSTLFYYNMTWQVHLHISSYYRLCSKMCSFYFFLFLFYVLFLFFLLFITIIYSFACRRSEKQLKSTLIAFNLELLSLNMISVKRCLLVIFENWAKEWDLELNGVSMVHLCAIKAPRAIS